jgi:hypothetical protein
MPVPLRVVQPTTPMAPMYLLVGMAARSTLGRSIFGVGVDGASLTFGRLGCEAIEEAMDIRGWFCHEPSRYMLTARSTSLPHMRCRALMVVSGASLPIKAWKRDGSKRLEVDIEESGLKCAMLDVSWSFSESALSSSGPEGSEAKEASCDGALSAKKRLFLLGRSSMCDMLILYS